MSGRPLDVLEESLNEPVVIHLKDGETYAGELAGYDQHMNVVLEKSAELGEEEFEEPAFTLVEDTTIIRGDNVVTIKA